ncbi:MAG: hypothetical protein LWW85_10490 [Marinilabiliales bacterium]|nr:hypothetical protein [Marinilabiliales bacterium]
MNKLLWLFMSVLLFSCSAIKEAITVPVNTTLKVDMPFTVSVTKSASLDKAGTTYSFTSTKVLQVSDNTDMTAYINKIKAVDLRAVTVTMQGLTGTQQVLTLDISVSGVNGPVFSIANISSTSNNPFSPTITSTVQSQLDLVAAKLVSDRQLTLTISGTTNDAPMSLTAQLAFDTKFTCMPLN